MKLAKVSKNLLYDTFDYWQLNAEYAETLYNYLVYGLDPGSFFHAVLANDFRGAIIHAHNLTDMEILKRLISWMEDYMPNKAYGSYHKVDQWLEIPEHSRRLELEKSKLIFTVERETWETLRS